jgi:ATP-dependent DNA helicase RecG
MQFRIANPVADEALLPAAQQTADLMLDRYSDHVAPLMDRWFGGKSGYGGV